MSEETSEKNKKQKVLIYGDEAIDTHLLIEKKSAEIVLNDKLNGQSVSSIIDRTGYNLIGKLMQNIYKKIDGQELDINYLCSCSEKANLAYYLWEKGDNKPDDLAYYKESFIGAKFDWLDAKKRKKIKKDSRMDTIQNLDYVDVLIFYNRHYEGVGCQQCNSQSCYFNSKSIKKLLDNQEIKPVIFIRTAGDVNSKEDKSQEIINLINSKDELRNNTIVLLKSHDLQSLGAELPEQYSWEDLIRSTYRELKRIRQIKTTDKYGMLVSAPLVIVDFDYDGYAAYVFSENDEDDKDAKAPAVPFCVAVYNKSGINGMGFKKISSKGSIPSSTSIMQAIVADIIIKEMKTNGKISGVIRENIENILKICYLSIYYYCSVGRKVKGYGINQKFCVDKESIASFIHTVYKIVYTTGQDEAQNMYRTFIDQHMPGSIILDEEFLDGDKSFSKVIIDNDYSGNTYELCKRIVQKGLLNTELPYVNFGKLLSIDTQEIKNYRHIYKLMQNKINHPLDDRKPLSFCVFGNPGSGKSFGVKQIAEEITGKKDNVLTFNLSQMNSVDDLCNAFVRISDFVLEGKVPIVFWDEFDTPFEGKKYGWLKYFLAPMEDGEYFHNNISHNIGSCVFIFAGSNVCKWEDFINLTKDNKSEQDKDLSKISDFISRILGYIDVLGPNPVKMDNVKKEESSQESCLIDDAYKLRRAIFVRQNIEAIYDVKKDEEFFIDDTIIKALIDVAEYKHGNRSLANLIKQFKINSKEAKHIKKYCIPNQLDLYVDQNSWQNIMKESEETRQENTSEQTDSPNLTSYDADAVRV